MSLSPGTRLGPYEVVDAIGAGGMGEVYEDTDTTLDRAVAIEALPQVTSEREYAMGGRGGKKVKVRERDRQPKAKNVNER